MDQIHFVFEPCKIAHDPPRPPHGRIVDTHTGCADDCSKGITVYTIDGAESLLEQLVRGKILDEETARRLLREIEVHHVPTWIPNGLADLQYYLAMRQLYANGGHARFWDGLMEALHVSTLPSD